MRLLFLAVLLSIVIIGSFGVAYAADQTVSYDNTAIPDNLPDVVYRATLTSTHDTIVIEWEEPARTPNDYRVMYTKAGEKFHSWKDLDWNAFPVNPSHTITDLEEDTEYKLKIRPRYGDSSGPWTNKIMITTGPTPPEPPLTPETETEPEAEPEDHTAELTELQNQLNDALAEIDRLNDLVQELQALLNSAPELGPSIRTDKQEYEIGETIHITGLKKIYPEQITIQDEIHDLTKTNWIISIQKHQQYNHGSAIWSGCNYTTWTDPSINDSGSCLQSPDNGNSVHQRSEVIINDDGTFAVDILIKEGIKHDYYSKGEYVLRQFNEGSYGYYPTGENVRDRFESPVFFVNE